MGGVRGLGCGIGLRRLGCVCGRRLGTGSSSRVRAFLPPLCRTFQTSGPTRPHVDAGNERCWPPLPDPRVQARSASRRKALDLRSKPVWCVPG